MIADGAFELREYQRDDVARIRAALDFGNPQPSRVLFVGVTGQGKTVEASSIVPEYLAGSPDRRVHIFTPTRETADQWVLTLARFHVHAGYVLAGKEPDPTALVQVGTVATAARRALPPAGMVIVDEAQHAPAPTWAMLLKRYSQASILGLSGTPWRYDGRALGAHFDVLVQGQKPAWLAERGYIATPEMYSWPSGVMRPMKDGAEYSMSMLHNAAGKILVGDLFEHRKRLAPAEPTLAFCCTIDHSKTIAAGFVAEGIPAEHIDGHMSLTARRETLERFRCGKTQVLTTVAVLTEGFDMPEVRCVIFAAPTRSLAKHLQQCGRGLRPGTTPIFIDHAGNLNWHESPLADREWSLEGTANESRRRGGSRMLTCVSCHRMFLAAGVNACPGCGTLICVRRGASVEEVAGQLVPYHAMTDQELWAVLKVQKRTARHPGSAAASAFRAMRGREPPGWQRPRTIPDTESLPDQEAWEVLKTSYRGLGNAKKAFWKQRGYDPPGWAEGVRARKSDAGRIRMGSMTPEQRAARSRKLSDAWAAMPPERRADRSQKIANTRKSMPEERKAELLRQRRANTTPEMDAARVRKAVATRAAATPEQKAETARKRWETVTPERRSASARKAASHPSMAGPLRAARTIAMNEKSTPQERSDRPRKAYASMTPEQREARNRKLVDAHAARTPEQKAERQRNVSAAFAARTPEQKAESVRRRLSSTTHQQRSEQALKTWETRRRNAAAKSSEITSPGSEPASVNQNEGNVKCDPTT